MHDDVTHKEPASVNKTQGACAEQDLRALMTQHLFARMQRNGDALVIVSNGCGLRVLQPSCAQPLRAQPVVVEETTLDGEE